MRTLLSRGVYLGPFVGRQLCMDRWSSDEFRNDFRCQLAMPRLSEEIGDFGGYGRDLGKRTYHVTLRLGQSLISSDDIKSRRSASISVARWSLERCNRAHGSLSICHWFFTQHGWLLTLVQKSCGTRTALMAQSTPLNVQLFVDLLRKRSSQLPVSAAPSPAIDLLSGRLLSSEAQCKNS